MHASLFIRVFFFARCLVHFPLQRCVHAHISSRAVSVLSQAIFKPCSPQHALSPLPHFLKISARQREPHTRQVPFVFPPLRPRFGESKPPSHRNVDHNESISHRRGNAFEGLCVHIRGRLGEHTGMSYLPSWHETERLRVPENPPLPFTVVSH